MKLKELKRCKSVSFCPYGPVPGCQKMIGPYNSWEHDLIGPVLTAFILFVCLVLGYPFYAATG
jgi:hypothetical protein